MADEMDIKPNDPDPTPDSDGEHNPLPCAQPTPPDLPTSPSAEEGVAVYANLLQNAPGFPWQPVSDGKDAQVCFDAPYITAGNADALSDAQLIAGIFVNIPRSHRLWVGDQLKLRWGYNTFYTTVGEAKGRGGPRLTQYLNSERLADYENGVVEVRYEVVRRSRLVGISHTLLVTLLGQSKGRYRSSSRTRAMRRRKPRL
ncbi:hypothetical protein ACIPL1_23335 [Pseudomonas sp. NPDC090202]|uniref:hypothetical protein n=1 Tax=unclassified Pseudomonas TaxID=196821 RepID=UPI0037F22841